MATSTTYPSDGRLTSMSTYAGPMTGAEVFPIVYPNNPAQAVNYQLPATTLATFIQSIYPPQSANFFFAGPVSGPAQATPTFRAQVIADLPQGTAGLPLVGNGAGGTTNFQVLGLPGGGSGTTALPNDGVVLANGSSPLSVAFATTAGYPLVSNGSALPPSFQALPLGTAFVSGVLNVSFGGSGTSALSSDGLLLGNGSAPFGVVVATTAGYPLVSNGSTTAPSFQQIQISSSAFTGIWGVPNGGIGTGALATNAVLLGEGTGPLNGVNATSAGYPLVSNGSASAPGYQVLPVTGGGLGTVALATNAVLLGEGTGPLNGVAATTAGYALIANGPSSAPSYQAQPLGTAFVSGVLNVSFGGSGTTTLTGDGLLLANGSAPFGVVAATTAGLFLTSQGSTTPPNWTAIVSLSGPGAATANDVPYYVNATTLGDSGIPYTSLFTKINVQTFTATATYTASANLVFAVMECQGGGAAGGGVTGASAGILGAPGGGSGAFSRSVASAAALVTGLLVTIGSAGAGVVGTTGGNGGTTSIGTLCSAPGGVGGGGLSGSALGLPGTGAPVGTGNACAAAGNAGGGFFNSPASSSLSLSSGFGAPSHFGGGAPGVGTSTGTSVLSGKNGSAYGAGGSGAFVVTSNGSTTGGSGALGYAVIFEYLS